MINLLEPYQNQFDKAKRRELFALALKTLRKNKNLSQKEVANAIDVKVGTYNTYESGKTEPPLEILVRLSFLFNCSIDVLLQKSNMYGNTDEQSKILQKLTAEIDILQNNDNVKQDEKLSKITSQINDLIVNINESLNQHNNE